MAARRNPILSDKEKKSPHDWASIVRVVPYGPVQRALTRILVYLVDYEMDALDSTWSGMTWLVALESITKRKR